MKWSEVISYHQLTQLRHTITPQHTALGCMRRVCASKMLAGRFGEKTRQTADCTIRLPKSGCATAGQSIPQHSARTIRDTVVSPDLDNTL